MLINAWRRFWSALVSAFRRQSRSIGTRAMLVITVALLLIMAADTITRVTQSHLNRKHDLDVRATVLAEMSAESLRLPLYEADLDTIGFQLKALYASTDFVSAVVYDFDGTVLQQSVREGADMGDVVTVDRPIMAPNNEQVRGSISIKLSGARLHAGWLHDLWTLTTRNTVLFFIILFVCWGVLRMILRPLKGLQMAVNRYGAGERDTPIPGLDRKDEYGKLSKAFRAMASQLNTLLTSLEGQVHERTGALESAKLEAEAANRAKSAFLASVSHELRTPLNGMLGMAQVLAASDLTEEQKEQVATIETCGHTLHAVVDDLLDFSKIDAGKMEIAPIDQDLVGVLNRVCRLWSPKAEEKGITLTLCTDPDMPRFLRFDPVRVTQCVANLVNNAIKFTERGSVTIEASAEPRSMEGAEGWLVTIRVADTGIGMRSDVIETLFKPFTQADRSMTRRFGGTGLGLSIVRNLARMMGGDVSVTSREGEGSVFTLTLAMEAASRSPGEDAACPFQRPELDPALPALIREMRIMIVDDNQINRKVLQVLLASHGGVSVHAEHGRMALDLLAEQDCDLVLLDLHMPVMDGRETIRAIRDADEPWSDVAIIAVTADAMRGVRERCLDLGADGYVSKPIDLHALLTEIAAIMPDWRTRADRASRHAV